MKSSSTVGSNVGISGFNFSALARNASKFYNTKIIGIDNISPQVSPIRGMVYFDILDGSKSPKWVKSSESKPKNSRHKRKSSQKMMKKQKELNGDIPKIIDRDPSEKLAKESLTENLNKKTSASTQETNISMTNPNPKSCGFAASRYQQESQNTSNSDLIIAPSEDVPMSNYSKPFYSESQTIPNFQDFRVRKMMSDSEEFEFEKNQS
jgi:hypothetical protein